jgi:hypothetical protein
MEHPVNYFQVLLETIAKFKLGEAAALLLVIFVYGFVLTRFARTKTGERMLWTLQKTVRTLFLFSSDSSSESQSRTRFRLIELEAEVERLRRSFSDKNLQAKREAIQSELESQLADTLPQLVEQKLVETNALNSSIDSSIRLAVEDAVFSFLQKVDTNQLISDRRAQLRLIERTECNKVLEATIDEQMRSAGRLKAVMINLFVLFNIGVLLIYLFAAANLSDRAIAAIIGLYVSLAAFIVYIYRSSNFRSSVLLALREDAKKYFDADEYIRRLKPGASPTDRDVEVLKLLMLNRTEREKAANHPYEVILKGVTNSNIQMKGGKMSTSPPSSRRDNKA